MSRPLAGIARAATIAAAAAALFGCEDGAHRDIQDEINILTRRNDALVPSAIKRLAAHGRLAIPQIETALHTAAPSGRAHLINTLEAIGDPEAVPIFRALAVYDVTPAIRAACEAVLARWSTGAEPRAARARATLARVHQKRTAGEGPVTVGDAGAPGIPPTIGSPQPVGAGLAK